MKTYYVLLWTISILAVAVVLALPLAYAWQAIFVTSVIILAYWESRFCLVRAVYLQNSKIVVIDPQASHVAGFLKTSVVGRFLCFLHLYSFATGKCWQIPISRLELPREVFKQLKCELQRFSIGEK